jgi:putative PepSY-like beta-lactamase-inhibitor
MNLYSKVVTASLVAGLAALSGVQAQDKKIKREELPAAVEKTVAQQSAGATIRGFSTEVEEGKRLYEVELTVNGHGKDISMDEQGNVVEVEEEVSLGSLPPAVKDGLTRAAGDGTIAQVESISKRGKLVAYEAVVKTGTKRSEIQVGPDGKKLAHPE